MNNWDFWVAHAHISDNTNEKIQQCQTDVASVNKAWITLHDWYSANHYANG